MRLEFESCEENKTGKGWKLKWLVIEKMEMNTYLMLKNFFPRYWCTLILEQNFVKNLRKFSTLEGFVNVRSFPLT